MQWKADIHYFYKLVMKYVVHRIFLTNCDQTQKKIIFPDDETSKVKFIFSDQIGYHF